MLLLRTVVGGGGGYFDERRKNERNAMRVRELQVEHGSIVVDIKRPSLDAPQDSERRAELERRLARVTAEHNAILVRHPTWTQKPLESFADAR